jgi:polysaccharide pyruvyl transferase WcaK-like protein
LLLGDVRYDQAAMQHFRNLLSKHIPACAHRRIIDEPVSSPEQLLSQLAATDTVVATRFHNVLLALILNKPVISISFHDKCVSLMDQMGLSEYCHDIEQLDVDRLIVQFRNLENGAEKLRALIQQRTTACRKALSEQDSVIFSEYAEAR